MRLLRRVYAGGDVPSKVRQRSSCLAPTSQLTTTGSGGSASTSESSWASRSRSHVDQRDHANSLNSMQTLLSQCIKKSSMLLLSQ